MGIFGSNQSGQARYSGELHNLQLTQSVFGTTASIIIGTRRVAAKLLFYGGFYAVTAPNSGGKGGGGKGSSEYDYYADMQLALASGSAGGGCQGVLSVWDQQGKLANSSGSYDYMIPFGGGTVSPLVAGAAPIQFDHGVSKSVSYSVVANDYGSGGSRTLAGTQSVAMRKVTGTPGAGQYNFNAATSSYTFSAADAGTHVTISYSSVFSLYYFQTTQPAEIPLNSPYQVSTNNQSYFWSDGGVKRLDTGAALVAGTDYTESDGVYTFASYLAGVYVYITYTFTSSDSSVTNTSTLNLTFFGGTLGQTPNSYWKSKYPGAAFGYTGICHVDANPMALGESATTPAYNYEVMGLDIFPGGGLDAHFCDGFRTLLYDAFLGVGFSAAYVDAWTSCYAYWAANGYLGSISLDTQTSVSDAISKVIETGNVGAVFSGGLLKLIPYGDATCVGNGYTYTPNTTPVATLTWNDLLPPSEKHAGETGSEDPLQVAQSAPQDCWNYVQAQWCNRLNDYNNELINEQNDAFISQYGRRIESPQTWDWITTAAAASWALGLRLKRQCYIRNTYKFWLSYRFSYIEAMDIVALPTGELVRITQTTDAPDGRRSMEAEQWSYGTGNVSIYPKQSPSSFQPGVSTALPGDAVPIFVQNTQQQSTGAANVLQIAASGQSANWGGCNVLISTDGETYVNIGKVMSPGVIGQLSAALPSSADPDTSDTLSVDISIGAGANQDAQLVSATLAQANSMVTLAAIVDQSGLTNELIAYETATLAAQNRYNLSYIRRGVYGTNIAAHAAGAWFAYLGAGYQFLEYQYPSQFVGGNLYVKLQSFNLMGRQLQSLAQCAVWTLTIGLQGCNVVETYVPSTYAPGYVKSPASVTNPAYAYDKNLSSGAVFSAPDPGGSGLQSTVNGTYSGFPNVVTTAPMTLYISYDGLACSTAGGASQAGSIRVGYGYGSGIVGNVIEAGTAVAAFGGIANASSGLAVASIPAGTNLSTLQVEVAGVSSVSGAGLVTLTINEIWIQ